jgi:hypothetical protein
VIYCSPSPSSTAAAGGKPPPPRLQAEVDLTGGSGDKEDGVGEDATGGGQSSGEDMFLTDDEDDVEISF